MPTLVRPRAWVDGAPVYPGHNYLPQHLLYEDARWRGVPPEARRHALRRALPEPLRSTWDRMCLGQHSGPHEEQAMLVARWLTRHGRDVGVRVAATAERATACGLSEYAAALGVGDAALADAIGRSFDPAALFARIAAPLAAVLAGMGQPEPRSALAADRLHAQYLQLAAAVRRMHPALHPADWPGPTPASDCAAARGGRGGL